MSGIRNTATAERDFAEHEHRELRPGLDRIHDVASRAGEVPTPQLSLALLDVMRWAETVLQPHAAWEETTLYPEVDRAAGTPWATKVMRFEHAQVRELADRLHVDHARLNEPHELRLIEQVRYHLFGLEAILRAHIQREERFLMPLLDGELAVASAD